MDPTTLSIERIATAVQRREIAAETLVQAFLARIKALNGELNAFITVDEDGALEQARQIDRRVVAGERLGPLAGVPLALKDLLVTRGLRTTCGSTILRNWVPTYDGTVVGHLRRADAIILGKTNMDEFAMGSSNENSAMGPCRNPWDLQRVSGGSSGGSAASVAARLCAGAVGTDTGGSIRQPAAFCGVSGLKPTYGRVSRYGVVAFASSLDQVGPLATGVDDCAALLEVMGGHDPLDSTSLNLPRPLYREACKRSVVGLKLGIPEEYFGEGLDPEIARSVREAIAAFQRLGVQTTEVSLPHTPQAIATYYLICMAEASANLARYDGVRFGLRSMPQDESGPNALIEMYRHSRREGFGREVKRRIMLGTFVLSAGYYEAYYGKAQRVRTLIRRDFEEAFSRCDAIVAPTSPCTAFPIGAKIADPLQMYLADIFTISCNLAGLPGLSIPCGFSQEQRLPIGLQLLAPPLAEETLFALGGAYQRQFDWHLRLPEVRS
jgi:aspartyl-tRNA(Asn)/glutamyl-tRNA(Gln) amidotransferase subunit A